MCPPALILTIDIHARWYWWWWWCEYFFDCAIQYHGQIPHDFHTHTHVNNNPLICSSWHNRSKPNNNGLHWSEVQWTKSNVFRSKIQNEFSNSFENPDRAQICTRKWVEMVNPGYLWMPGLWRWDFYYSWSSLILLKSLICQFVLRSSVRILRAQSRWVLHCLNFGQSACTISSSLQIFKFKCSVRCVALSCCIHTLNTCV